MKAKDIRTPEDLQPLSFGELQELAADLRREIITTVSKNGGHLASNLGAVELTLALHRAYHMPKDKIIFDVGHQSYTHKLITGRYQQFSTIRTMGGLSGFPKRSESPYDVFETGHSSTAISAALGMARARDLLGQDHLVVAVVGDGALTGGMCYEAMNDVGSNNTRLTVVLNDNEMSISRNVGALSRHLTELRVSKGWTGTKQHMKSRLARTPIVGKPVYNVLSWSRNLIKSIFVDEGYFRALGFHYYGPVDGHDIRAMERVFRRVQQQQGPVLVHVLTQKGKGYRPSEDRPDRFHGVAPFYEETGAAKASAGLPSCGAAMAEELAELADRDPRIVAITAAMMSGTGLSGFQKRHPDRVFDVGITEEHALTMCAGMAAGGLRPFFAVYTSFFQRCFDQMIHDVAMQQLPVTMLLDRAGLVGEDGQTHQGVYDFASVIPIPGMTMLAPRDLVELRAMLRWAAAADVPAVIRYGKAAQQDDGFPHEAFVPGRWQTLLEGSDVTLLAVGSMVSIALNASVQLAAKGISAGVVSCPSVKPLDTECVSRLNGKPYVTLEEHALRGGFGSSVAALCVQEHWTPPAMMLGVPDRFVPHGSREQQLSSLGLDPEHVAAALQRLVQEGKA